MEEKTELTRREKEVFDLIFAGKSNADIADALVIAEGTVEGHVRNILRKLGAQSRGHAVHIALKNHLITDRQIKVNLLIWHKKDGTKGGEIYFVIEENGVRIIDWTPLEEDDHE